MNFRKKNKIFVSTLNLVSKTTQFAQPTAVLINEIYRSMEPFSRILTRLCLVIMPTFLMLTAHQRAFWTETSAPITSTTDLCAKLSDSGRDSSKFKI